MPRIIFSLLVLVGSLAAVSGLVMQRRAVRAYGKAAVSRAPALDPRRWWPAWRVAEMFADPRGIRSYVMGGVLFAGGMTVVWFALGFIAGRW